MWVPANRTFLIEWCLVKKYKCFYLGMIALLLSSCSSGDGKVAENGVRVKKVFEDGVIELVDGRKVNLLGLKCDKAGSEVVKSMIEKELVVVIPVPQAVLTATTAVGDVDQVFLCPGSERAANKFVEINLKQVTKNAKPKSPRDLDRLTTLHGEMASSMKKMIISNLQMCPSRYNESLVQQDVCVVDREADFLGKEALLAL